MDQIVYKKEFKTYIMVNQDGYIVIEQPSENSNDIDIVSLSKSQAIRLIADIQKLMELIED